MFTTTRTRRAAVAIAAVAGLLLGVAACSSSDSGSDSGSGSNTPAGSPSSSPSTSPSTGPAAADCTEEAILAAVPGGAEMEKFECAKVGDTEWAAAEVNPGNTVFFLQWNGSSWNAEDSDSVCGTASAGLPESLLSYCKP